ncbi:uncharacterized protein LOC132273182 [Cornus florida]|uniref:uncharacterized protein LOC132273182 n=1 Tax=Cornus florida TaxID=4283 RepID=UPI00289DD9E5|nr:uncharacterized protein LOC132273182 [Cornus florida]
MARGLIKHKIGNGSDTSLWLDYWLPNGPFYDQLHLTDMKILQLNSSIKVDSLIFTNQWVIPPNLQYQQFLQSNEFTSQLQDIPTPFSENDETVWLPGPTKQFSLSHTIKYQSPPSLLFTWSHLLWYKINKPKHSCVTWLACRGKLFTLDTKPMRKKHYTNACYLCLSDAESLDHLFFNCSFSAHIWRFIQHVAGFYVEPRSWGELISWCSSTWRSRQFNIHKLFFNAAVYFIWLERNARAFKNRAASPQHIICLIKSCIRAKLSSLKLNRGAKLRLMGEQEDLLQLFMQGCVFARNHTWCANSFT